MLLKDFLTQPGGDAAKGVSQKNILFKRKIVAHIAVRGESTLAELAGELRVSIPTVTKLVDELGGENIVVDKGKASTHGGRRPNVFALAEDAMYFVGVDIGHDGIRYVVINLGNNVVPEARDERNMEEGGGGRNVPEHNERSVEDVCGGIERFIAGCGVERGKIFGVGVCVPGRVNAGRSYTHFAALARPLGEIIEERVGIRVTLDNSTRARCYAEYAAGAPGTVKNMLYLHIGRNVAAGIVVDRGLYYGKSGFAGDWGHTPLFDNDKTCHCGKKGCLETEASAAAVENRLLDEISRGANTSLREKYDAGEAISIYDIVEAADRDDSLSMELIAEAGAKAGRGVALMLNIFNPEVVVVGGSLSRAGDHLMLPLKAAANRHTPSLVYKDTEFRLSTMGDDAAARGAAMLIRNQITGI